MAVNALIHLLDQWGISATIELPGGKWTHSREYLAVRVNGLKGLQRVLLEKAAQGDERARVQFALVAQLPLEEVDRKIEVANEGFAP